MHGRRAVAATVGTVLLFAGACAPKDAKKAEEEDSRHALTPTYAPTSTTAPTDAVVPTTNADASVPTSGTDAAPISSVVTVTAQVSASVTDASGDVTPSPLDKPPAWADLAGATLTLDSSGFTLAIHLGGGQAPGASDSDHTMNIGTFYDVNGDGRIDDEVWANLTSNGWSGAWFDDQRRTAILDDSKIRIDVEGDAVVLRFPRDRVANVTSFRWSLASEWGKYDVIGTVAAARDDDPDNDQPASFPG